MKKLFENVRATASLYKHVKEARDAGATAFDLRPVWKLPAVKPGIGFLDTVEGCQLSGHGSVYSQVRQVFDRLPYELQHALTFSPKEGELLGRVKIWRYILSDEVPERVYHRAMELILRWYRVIRYGQFADTEEYIAFRERMTARRLSDRERELIFMWNAKCKARK